MNDSHSVGTANEALVAGYLAAQGYSVFVPLSRGSRCDLVYLSPSPIRVQVKTGTLNKAGNQRYEQCRLVPRGSHKAEGSYSSAEVDEVWVVGTHLWKFPIEAVAGMTSLSLNNPTIRTQPPKRYNPDDYIVVRGSSAFPYRARLGLQENV